MPQTVVVESILHSRWRGAIFNGRDPDGNLHRFVADDMPRPPVSGEAWTLSGVRKRHPKHGLQVHVQSAVLARPAGKLIISLLSGDHFPGVGPVSAHLLWGRFGEELYEILDRGDAEAIIEALGGSSRAREQAAILIAVWPEVAVEPKVLAWLDRHAFSLRLARKLIGCWGADAIAMLEGNPYRMIAFASWPTVDRAARAMGIGPADERRLVAACEAALYSRLGQSHTWTSDEALRTLLTRLLGDTALVDIAIDLAAEDGAAVPVDDGWQPIGPLAMERYVAERVASLINGDDAKASQPSLFHRRAGELLATGWLERWQALHGMKLNAEQREAIHAALTCPFSLLLGGAGVGKTTVLKAIFDLAQEIGVSVHPMALSGRAALRIIEATGRSARTIAGFLQRTETGEIVLDDEPLIVIDEGSMVDLTSLYRILRACPPGCRFLLVGDPGQLPPVSFGVTLHALAEHDGIPKVELVEVMRQAAETGIPAAAIAIRTGLIPKFLPWDASRPIGVSFVECEREQIVGTIKEIRAELAGQSSQIIGSTKGIGREIDGGIRAINNALHAVFAHGRETLTGGFVVGEPVIWTVNDYDLRVMNGSLGTVVEQQDDMLMVDFDGDQREIPVEVLSDLELAWAITAHKAQGSQFDTVIVPVAASRILDRTLLYTAMTRARRRVVLVGDRRAFDRAILELPSSSRRQTGMRVALHNRVLIAA